ncbi:Cytochrome P450 98A3 [Acorus calamus]|uniref:Cytochrome P450 98A3 n=1 Tax=Acorus calamus TaxID=4465 RepID=A0AAV9EYF4_ACOCL|nr:Cytochrome P450 98A3 [Acorus calamus]
MYLASDKKRNDEFHYSLNKAMELIGEFRVEDFFPSLAWIWIIDGLSSAVIDDHAAFDKGKCYTVGLPQLVTGETVGPTTRGRLQRQEIQLKKASQPKKAKVPSATKTYKQLAKEKHQLTEEEQVALAIAQSKIEAEKLQSVYTKVDEVLRQNYPGKEKCTPKQRALVEKFLENPVMDDSPVWEVADDGSFVHPLVTRKHLFEVISNQWLGEEDLIAAATDTSYITIEWAMVELIHNP